MSVEQVFEEKRAAREALEEKRAAAIVTREAARDARGGVALMRYSMSVPGGFYNRFCKDKAANPPPSPEEQTRLDALADKRAAAISKLEFKRECERVFEIADLDGSGSLDMEELTNIRNSQQMAEFMLEQSDADQSGTLSLEEFTLSLMDTYSKSSRGAEMILFLYEQHALGKGALVPEPEGGRRRRGN